MRVVRFEDYIADRVGVVTEVSRFLGLEPAVDRVRADVAYNKSEAKPLPSGWWSKLYHLPAYRRLIRPLLPQGFKQWCYRRFLPKAPARPDPPTAATRAWLLDQLAPDLRRLQEIMELDGEVWPELMSDPDGPSEPAGERAEMPGVDASTVSATAMGGRR